MPKHAPRKGSTPILEARWLHDLRRRLGVAWRVDEAVGHHAVRLVRSVRGAATRHVLRVLDVTVDAIEIRRMPARRRATTGEETVAACKRSGWTIESLGFARTLETDGGTLVTSANVIAHGARDRAWFSTMVHGDAGRLPRQMARELRARGYRAMDREVFLRAVARPSVREAMAEIAKLHEVA